ncbi:MAG: hypothetical protein LUE16_00620 [Lachnospiraceae bacterium]|nr:hypothetical protein [Lachnospiraceae bacterium]
MKLLEMLHSPGDEYTPIPFWFLNGNLSGPEIIRQMEDFAAHGVSGVVLHPRMGLPKRIKYLSKAYFGYIRTAVETARRLHMTVVLYDEGMYPSGSANGKVVEGHPEFASVGITLTRKVQPGDEFLTQAGDRFLVARKTGGTMRGIHWDQEDGEPNTPLTADLLNPAAVDRFIELTHEAYYREFGEYFGTTIKAFFTDEPSIMGRNVRDMFAWSHNFAQIFTEAGGNLSGLSELFFGRENDDTRLYEKLILQREGEVYYKRLSDWCAAHGICLMGHPHQSDDIEALKYFHIPGQDLVLRWISPEKGGLKGMDSTMAKCSADAARLMGRRRNANECFGACNADNNPWQFSGSDMKWYLDWLAVRGVNLFVPHAFYYSIEGKRKEERPPDVGPNNIWWPYYHRWSGYMRRLSCLMTDADLHTPVAVLCKNRALCPEAVAPLFESQTGFQYIPESYWKDCTVDDETHELICQGKRYQAVLNDVDNVFPRASCHVTEAMADCLCFPATPALRCAHFVRGGVECWFLTNEGNRIIETTLTLPGVTGKVGKYDIWRDEAFRQATLQGEDGAQIRLYLRPRQSRLFFVCSEEEFEALPVSPKRVWLPKPKFTQVGRNTFECTRTYTATLEVTAEELEEGIPMITFDGYDMAELRVNGQDAGVSFWPTHRFEVGGLIHEGENELEVTMTGSLANKYGIRAVPYGVR